jgi:DNA ligase 4
MSYLSRRGYFERVPFAQSVPEFEVGFDHRRQLQPAELFKHPFVVELMGVGFDKPADARYYTLRFPRVLKIHQDRTIKDTVSFDELQEMVLRSQESPEDSEGEENDWLERLRRKDYLDERSRSSSPSDDSNPAPLSETTAVDTYHYAGKQSAQPQEKANTSAGLPHSDNSFFHSSKRKMVSGTSLSAIKRAKLE